MVSKPRLDKFTMSRSQPKVRKNNGFTYCVLVVSLV